MTNELPNPLIAPTRPVGYFHKAPENDDLKDFHCYSCAVRTRRVGGERVMREDLSKDYCEICVTCGTAFGGEHDA